MTARNEMSGFSRKTLDKQQANIVLFQESTS